MSFWGKCFQILKMEFLFECRSAVTFLKHWKQKNAEITHQWDLMEFEEEEVKIFNDEDIELIISFD